MRFNGITKKGKAYLAEAQAKKLTFEFTKIAIGDGRLDNADNPAELNGLIHLKKDLGVLGLEHEGEVVTLTTNLDNVGLGAGYYPREIGIFVKHNGKEEMYYYMNDGDEVSWIPPESDGPFRIELKLHLIISSTSDVIVKNTGKGLYIDKKYANENFEKKFNKKTGFNLNKSDSISYDSSNALATSKAVNTVYDYAKTKVETLYDIKITGHMLDSTSGYYGFTYGNGGIGISGSNSIGFKSTSTTYCLNYDQIEGSAKIDKFAFFAASGSGTYATIQAGDMYSNGVKIPTTMTKVWSGSIRATNTKICNMPADWQFAVVVYNWGGGAAPYDAQITVPNADITNLGDCENEYFVTVKDGQIYTGSWNGQGEDGVVKAIYAMV